MSKLARNNVSRLALGYALAGGLCMVNATAAYAADEDDADSGSGLDTILVVAQKREQNLQDVPVSIVALTADTLENSGVGNSPLDLAVVTPGLQTTQVVAGFSPRIRGIGSTDSTPGNEGAVSVYVDGVYIPGSANGLISLSNIERIEVLKGPQGTLFGRNTTGGLIQVITKRPSYEPTGKISATYANYDTKTISGYVSTGLTENVAIDFAGRWEDQGNFWGTNVYDGSGAYRIQNHSFRSKLLAEIGDNTEITIAGDYYKYENDVAPFRRQVPSGFYDYATDLNSFQHGETWGVNGRLENDFGTVKLVSITSYRDIEQGTTMDIDLSPVPFQHAFFESNGKSFTQEVQLLSTGDSKLDWIVGAFYFDRTAQFEPGAQEGAVLQIPTGQPGWLPLDRFEIYNRQKTESIALFGQATYPILENVNLTIGLRYTKDTQKFRGFNRLYPTGGIPPVIETPAVLDKLKADKVSYRVALDYHFTPDVMAYLTYNTGFKSGFFNISGFPAGSAKPEFLKALEGGIKTQLLDNRLRFNLSAYHYDYEDVQSIYILQGQAIAVNAGSAEVIGVELDTTMVPVDGWNIRFGFNWMPKAKYDSFSPCPGPQNPPFVLPPGSATYDCSGSRMVNAPRWDITLGTDYTIQSNVGDFNLSANYQYTSKFPWDADFGVVPGYNTGVFTESGHSLLNAQLKWTGDMGLSVALWGKNLTKTKYLVNANQSSGSGPVGLPGAPRTYGVTIGAEF